MNLTDILQRQYESFLKINKFKFYDYTDEQREELFELFMPPDLSSSHADREFRELITLLTINNIYRVKDLADKLKNN